MQLSNIARDVGEDGEETVVVHVTDMTREIQGVPCRVVIDAVVVAEHDVDTALESLSGSGERAWLLGRVGSGNNGVVYE